VESAERKTPGLGYSTCARVHVVSSGFAGVDGSTKPSSGAGGAGGGMWGCVEGGVQSERSLEPTVKKVNNGKGETAEGEEALQPRKKRAKG